MMCFKRDRLVHCMICNIDLDYALDGIENGVCFVITRNPTRMHAYTRANSSKQLQYDIVYIEAVKQAGKLVERFLSYKHRSS